MIAMHFILANDDKSTGYSGLVVGKTPLDLFTALDEFCDPNKCWIKPVTSYSGFGREVLDLGDDVGEYHYQGSERVPFSVSGETVDSEWRKFRDVFPTVRYGAELADADWKDKCSEWLEVL